MRKKKHVNQIPVSCQKYLKLCFIKAKSSSRISRNKEIKGNSLKIKGTAKDRVWMYNCQIWIEFKRFVYRKIEYWVQMFIVIESVWGTWWGAKKYLWKFGKSITAYYPLEVV